ncbi:hypothetical protein THF1C08_60219 [Vibrio jasicida]|uniref:Uncharacterized protein n=1 Tax=Vibrio jasicida TaxID=766224 RepID=A0AAU9QMQ6_9VIBR|nr:hypothetical protein THF1A12_30017 [Vibrio jasicida]CAH1600612.1 hypothetical protein THF1C08_60219 [Vibrio jasicida]
MFTPIVVKLIWKMGSLEINRFPIATVEYHFVFYKKEWLALRELAIDSIT